MLNKIRSLEYTEERYNRLLQYLTDYIYTVKIEDGKAIETYHSPGCVTVTGYTSENYARDKELWYRMVFDEDKPKVLEQAQKARAGEDVSPLEHRIVHRDGTFRWVKNSIVLFRDESGNVKSYDGLINDITAVKRAEGLAFIKQKQLIQADKMASLGILVSGIAHEINNPNNFILLNAELFSNVWKDVQPILKEYYDTHGDFVLAGMPFTKSNEKIQKSLKGISDGAMRIQKITRSLTNYASNDPGELNQTVDLKKVVDGAITIAGSLIKNSTNNFWISFKDKLPNITGNKQQLEQVIINLINNSCQSLRNKNESIEISLSIDQVNQVVVIELSDEGVGIDNEHLKHIFDPFFTTKRNVGGTGLGLSISYNIVKNHGGDLIISSVKGEGTTSKIILPIKKN
ncbi:MAG: hypothetical protein CVV23_04525 [Ignavibacteriae bacterium HGW-Ignavibacteriae-2]|jgi:PAS domain S-box-containing protein|nr:PAS domain-containing sensor histidine kinase [Bacteroidota bacterium]PKL89607.1 MAG: hypothetical protein CVV23_04525 [Ignavibacteriae bacterium HGW-Ignavibacteriae-2]